MKTIRYIAFFVIGLLLAVPAFAQQNERPVIPPVTSTEGYDFFITFLPNGNSNPKDGNLKLQLLISSREVPGKPEITENNVRIVYGNGTKEDITVPVNTTVPYEIKTPANVYPDLSKGEEERNLDKGIRVYSTNDVPMTVYATNEYGSNTSEGTVYSLDGTHVLPIEALGNEYVVQTASLDRIATELIVMSTKPGTTNVHLNLTAGSFMSGSQEINITFTKPNQIYLVRSSQPPEGEGDDRTMDFSGSIICADQPVAVWSGNQLAHIPANEKNISQDYAADQLLPVTRWGKEFIVPLTGLGTRWNEVHFISLANGNNVRVYGNKNATTATTFTLDAGMHQKYDVKGPLLQNILDSTLYIKADEPIQVYLYSTSGVVNLTVEEKRQGNPAMTMISPLEYLTDTMVFAVYDGAAKSEERMSHQATIWSKTKDVKLDGVSISDKFSAVLTKSGYYLARVDIEIPAKAQDSDPEPIYHILTAESKAFGGYVIGMDEGLAYMYPIGYDFILATDSLFLADKGKTMAEEDIPYSEWNAKYPTNGGWYLDRIIQPDEPPLLDSIFICDSTTLTFPTKMHTTWEKVRWEIKGSLQGMIELAEDQPQEQHSKDVANPSLKHQFVLDPQRNKKPDKRDPYEDFEVRAIVFHEPIICEEADTMKWPRDTMNAIVRVKRIYNDTTYKIVCSDETFKFFKDTMPDGTPYETTFYYKKSTPSQAIQDLPEEWTYKFDLGENGKLDASSGVRSIMRHYTTVLGCDSFVYLRLFVCESIHDTLPLTLCQDKLEDLNGQLGEFFSEAPYRGDFVAAFENKTGNWTQLPDNSWTFDGTSHLTNFGCVSSIPAIYFNKGASYSGCDSTLTLQLRVIPTQMVPTTIVACEEPYVWKDINGATLGTYYSTSPQIGGKNKHYTERKAYPYNVCNDCPTGGCDSIVYTLDLMFADLSGIDVQEEHVCQNKPKTVTHSDASGSYTWTFNVTQPWAKAGSRIEGEIISFTTADNCTYKKQVVFIVDTVVQKYDTIVECFTDATGGILRHEWPGHNPFWLRKDGATTPTLSYGFFTTEYPTDGRRHYFDLIDTTKTGTCEEIYYRHVIVMPNYVLELPPHNMTVEEYFEFGNKIYAGEEATGLPSGKTIERLGMGEWPLTTEGLKTKPQYRGDQGCDSVVSVLLRIGRAFADTTYAYACGLSSYTWRDDRYPTKPHNTNIIDENGNHFNGAINVPQVTVPTVFHYYDSLKTKYPVPELDSIWVLSLTVYPSFFDATYVSTCQDSAGYNWVNHMGADHDIFIDGAHVGELDSIPALRTGVYMVEDRLQTSPRDFRHPLNDTVIKKDIVCDSIYTLYLTVNTTYTDEFQKVEYDRTLKSNDTLTFFTEPVQLFIGEDYDYAGHNTSLSAFYTQFGTDNVHIITDDGTTFVEGVEDRHVKSQLGCDSTTFLNISLCRLIKHVRTDSIGDNDTIWHFGGTQTPLEGEIYHSQPYVTIPQVIKDSIINRYAPIDRTSTTRPVYTFHFVDSMTSVNGCDSIEDRYLAVFPTYFYQETRTICHTEHDPSMTTWRDHKDLNLLLGDEETGTVYVNDTLFTYRSSEEGAKFDSILSLAVTILPGVLWYGHRTICMNDTFMWHGDYVYYDPELFYDLDSVEVVHVFQDAVYACGREYHMALTIDSAFGYTGGANYMDYVTDTVMCQYDEFHWFDKHGNEHRGNLSDPQGNKYDLPPTGEVGWFTIYDSLKTHDCGCDSIYTLRYYVDRAYQFFTDTALCEGDVFEWEIDNGVDPPFIYNSYTAEVVGSYILDTLHGESMSHCDSSYYLNIHVEGPVKLHLEDTLCYEDSAFVFDGIMHRDYTALIKESHTWSKPRVFEDTLYTVTKRARCDSTVYLRLTIGPSADSTWRDTICIGETFHLYGKELTQPGVYQYTLQNEFGCTSDYYLTLDVLPPTEFEISTEPLCVNKTGVDNTYELHYTYSGEFGPLTYSVLYDDKALALGFEDFTGEPITIPADEHVAGEQHTLHIPVPEFYEKEEFPKPDLYHAVIKFDNGVCLSDSLMTYPFAFRIDYPDWITEQRHGDLIAILNDQYNGGYVWTDYQWYQGDSLLVGQTKPYLYIPTGLEVGEEYHVELIREGDSIAFPTCPITIIENPVPDDYAPKQGYLAVTPTCIVPGNPYITILSRKDGTYRITSVEGHFISEGAFQADATRVPVPSTEGMYIVQLWSNDTPEEPYRAIKIIVQSACPKCDISSF